MRKRARRVSAPYSHVAVSSPDSYSSGLVSLIPILIPIIGIQDPIGAGKTSPAERAARLKERSVSPSRKVAHYADLPIDMSSQRISNFGGRRLQDGTVIARCRPGYRR